MATKHFCDACDTLIHDIDEAQHLEVTVMTSVMAYEQPIADDSKGMFCVACAEDMKPMLAEAFEHAKREAQRKRVAEAGIEAA